MVEKSPSINIKERSSVSGQDLKKETETKILSVMLNSKEHKLRWKDLLEQTKPISKKTLAHHLKELVTKGTIVRTVDHESKEYPPPVFYKVTGFEELEASMQSWTQQIAYKEFKKVYEGLLVNYKNAEFVLGTFLDIFYSDLIFSLYQTCSQVTRFRTYGEEQKYKTIIPVHLIRYHVAIYEQLLKGVCLHAASNPDMIKLLGKLWKEREAEIKKLKTDLKDDFISNFSEETKPVAAAFFTCYIKEGLPKKDRPNLHAEEMAEFLCRPDLQNLLESELRKKISLKTFNHFKEEAVEHTKTTVQILRFA
jgi:DNA-binding HxlR family transcriptional regulator